jgi:hypothetical protein
MGRELSRSGGDRQGGQPAAAELPEVVYDAPIAEVADVPVFEAWGRVMRDVKSIAKLSDMPSFGGGGGGRIRFRGINEVYGYVGPALRRHGVMVVPFRTETTYRDTKSAKGSVMRECTALVTFRVYGPRGDFFEGQAAGEAQDTGDKATSKAQSIALRVFVLETVFASMNEPDPESVDVERGESFRSAASYAREITAEGTSPARLQQIWKELGPERRAEVASNELGDAEGLGEMLTRIGQDGRYAAPAAAAPAAAVANPDAKQAAGKPARTSSAREALGGDRPPSGERAPWDDQEVPLA